MQPIDVLFCIEHVARELNIACAVRSIAERGFGLNVHIHVLSNGLNANFPTPRLITVPYCGSRRFVPRDVMERFRTTPVLSLTCEQLLSHENRRYRLPKDQFARKQVIYGAAGGFYRDWLLDAKVSAENIELVGSLPFQLYRKPYREMFESKRDGLANEHGLNPNLPWVLFPENFGAAFFSLAQARKRLRGGYRARQLLAYINYAKKSFGQIARWCAEAAAQRRIELIVRPRPAISYDVFTKRFLQQAECGRQPHLHFIKEGPIQEWILASQVVISSYSTTLLEAAAAGTPTFMLMPNQVPESAASEWHVHAPTIRTNDEFQAAMANADRAPEARALREWAEQNLLSHGDAIDNVARLLNDLCQGKKTAPQRTKPPWAARLAEQTHEWLGKPERFVRTRLRPGRRRIFGHECDDIKRREIEMCHEAWAQLLNCSKQSCAA